MSELKEMPRREGFWYSMSESGLPKPTLNASKWTGQETFLANLKAVENHWGRKHRAAVEAHNKAHATYFEKWQSTPPAERGELPPQYPEEVQVVSYRGSSTCRICGDRNGSTEFNIAGWQWPSGFRHYVEVHNLRPSLAFQEFILGGLIK